MEQRQLALGRGFVGFGEFDQWIEEAGFIGALSGFYFTVYVITDATYREEFFTEIVREVRQSLAVRTIYLALVRSSGPEGHLGD